jgi:RNA polymerase sigma-70 factor, ECF subfamily
MAHTARLGILPRQVAASVSPLFPWEANVDEKAAREFVQRLTAGQRRIHAFIRSQVCSRDDADEVMQQTTTVLWEKYGSFRQDGDFVRWACGVARLEVLTHLRNSRRVRVMLGDDVAEAVGRKLADAAVDVDLRIDMLVECMKDLAGRDRDLIERHYRSRQSVAEIAAALGLSESSVYKRLSHSRDMLYECIQQRLSTRNQS